MSNTPEDFDEYGLSNDTWILGFREGLQKNDVDAGKELLNHIYSLWMEDKRNLNLFDTGDVKQPHGVEPVQELQGADMHVLRYIRGDSIRPEDEALVTVSEKAWRLLRSSHGPLELSPNPYYKCLEVEQPQEC